MPMVRTILPPISAVAEDMLGTGAHLRARGVRRLLVRWQRRVARGAPVDTAPQAPRFQARLDLDRAVGAVRPDPLPVLERSSTSSIVQLVTVVNGCVRRLVHLVHAEVILVAVEALVLLLRSSAHYPCDHRVKFAVTRREEFCEVPTIDFAGGNQSSDGGLQLLREAEGKLGVCRRLAAAMPDRRDPDRVGTRCSRWQWRMRRRSRAATRTPSPRRLRHYPDEVAVGRCPGSGAALAS